MSTIKIKIVSNNNFALNDIYNAVNNATQSTLFVLQSKWQQEAQNKLKSSLPDYLLGLKMDSVLYENGVFSGTIGLSGKLPLMLEKGFSSFDIKAGFAKSGKKHKTKNGGWYMTIPFRHGTPKIFMFGNSMPKNIYSQAKKLGNNQSLTVNGGQKTSWTGYKHKNNINDGLTKIIKQYASGKKQSQYTTFRRVSNKSDPASWQHPGYKGTKIQDTLKSYAVEAFKKAIDVSLSNI